MQSSSPSPQRPTPRPRPRGSSTGATSPQALLFVTFFFVCITMFSFHYHQETSHSSAVDSSPGALANPYIHVPIHVPIPIHRGKLLQPKSHQKLPLYMLESDLKHYSTTTENAVISSVQPSMTMTLPVANQSELNTNWRSRMFESLTGQIVLTANARSKIHLWDDVDVPQELHLENGKRKRVMFYMGWCAFFDMETLALSGGPAGEFVIWADLVTGMAALGFDLVFVKSICEFWRLMKINDGNDFDIVITDYDGMGTAENVGQFPRRNCQYYIVDGFGTQAAFNKRNFDLKRILTPYPFDNSNTPIHQITGVLPKQMWADERQPTGILWAKLVKYLFSSSDPSHKLLGVLRNVTRMAPLHTSLSEQTIDFFRKKHRFNDRIMAASSVRNRTEFLKLMTSSKFILGVGMPVDGPTALEAIAHGCTFINPVFNPPRQQRGKPTRFNYTSQHPFIEANFAPPHVYTIDIYDHEVMEKTIQKILNSPPPPPLIHTSNTPREYLQNLRKIFYDTPCDTTVSPNRHPGNSVYTSFTEYVDAECKVKICPDTVHLPEDCGREMYNLTEHDNIEKREIKRLKERHAELARGRSIELEKQSIGIRRQKGKN